MPRYRIELNRDFCLGDGFCVHEAPRVFALDASGLIQLLDPQGDDAQAISSAARTCPTEAIILYDADSGERLWPP